MGSLQHYVRWTFNGQDIKEPDNDRKYSTDDDTYSRPGNNMQIVYSLIVYNLQRHDQGVYKCNVHVGNEEDEQEYTVDLNLGTVAELPKVWIYRHLNRMCGNLDGRTDGQTQIGRHVLKYM